MSDGTESGFEDGTDLAEARDRLRAAVDPHGRTDRLPLSAAEGRALAEPVDGDIEVFDAVGEGENVARTGENVARTGENVARTGEDVEAGRRRFAAGHRLRPSDLGLLKAASVREVEARQRPTVGVVPTGEELVQLDPGPGEVVETNGLTVSRYVERWGGKATYRNVVTDEYEALRAAVERDLTKDVVVTTGGSSVGERDVVAEVVDELGEVLVHGVALNPGHSVAIGVVRETPIVVLPGWPVACIVTAVQFLRPAIKWAGGMSLPDHPTVEARLSRKLGSEAGVRTFAPVRLREKGGERASGSGRVAVPTRAKGAGVLSSVSPADGWVVVPEEREGVPADEPVTVEDWEYYP